MFNFYSELLGENIKLSSLLATNEKLEKTHESVADYTITGLTLSPHKSSGLGNLCKDSTDGCRNACVLEFAGRRVMESVRKASRNRTALFFHDKKLFESLLLLELSTEGTKAQHFEKMLLCRLNVASDLPWERLCPSLFELPMVHRFYDYTATYSRALQSLSWGLPYDLTYSVKESTTIEKTQTILDNGGNVAIVVDSIYQPAQKRFGCFPSWVQIGNKEYQTVDGDVHDVRLKAIDGNSKVILLRNKGTNKAKQHAITSGFAHQLDLSKDYVADKPTTIDGMVRIEWLEV